MSPSPPPSTSHPPSPSPSPRPSTTQPPIHTYHCLCSTLLLATPYQLSTLPTRAPPAVDQARILPLPRFRNIDRDELEPANPDPDPTAAKNPHAQQTYLPSLLLPALRPARKPTLVQREDGYERRRVWRCGRCGLGIGYEVENGEAGERGGQVRVMFVLDEGLVLTELMGRDGGGGKPISATAVRA